MKLSTKEIVLFPILGAIMFVSKLALEFLPNVHILAMLIIAYTIVFRKKAIYPIIIFIFLTGFFNGFGTWWVPYLYLWPLLWIAALLLPKNMPTKVAVPVYMATAALHGLFYGTLYAPFQALAFGLSFKGMISWIAAGFPWDCIHALGNLATASLTIPVVKILRKGMQLVGME